MADATAPQQPAPTAPEAAPAPAPAAAPAPDTVTALAGDTLVAISHAVKKALDAHHANLIGSLGTTLSGVSAADFPVPVTRDELEAVLGGALTPFLKRMARPDTAWMKWAAGAALLGSVFALVITKQVEATVYLGMVMTALGGLGYHAATQQAAPKGDAS